jgi:serine protease Do
VAEALEGVGRGSRAYAQAAASARAAARGTPRGYLGVRLSELSETRWTPEGRLVRYCAYPVVVSVEPASPAERAGLDAGDTLVAYGTRDLVRDGAVALDRLLVPGEPLRVRLRRGGRTVTRVITVGQRPAPQTWAYGAAPFARVPPFATGAASASGSPSAVRVAVGPRPARVSGAARPLVHVEPFTVDVPWNNVPWPTGEFDDRDDRGARSAERLRVDQQLVRRQTVELGALARQARVQVLTPDGSTLASGWAAGGSTALAGAQLVALDDDLREVLAGAAGTGEGPTRGVFVLKVLPGTPAAEAGLRAGDVVTAAAGRPVSTPAALQRVLAGRALAGRALAGRGADRRERAVALRVSRAGAVREVTLRW